MMCSLSIISASAETTVLQSWPRMLSPVEATMNPRASAYAAWPVPCSWPDIPESSSTLGAGIWRCSGPQLPPKGTSSLWFQSLLRTAMA